MAAFNLWNSGPTYACTNHFRSLGFLLGRKEIIYKGNLHTGRRLHSVSRHKEHLQGEWKQVYSNYTRSWKQPGCLICSIFILCFSCIRIKCFNTSFKTVTNKSLGWKTVFSFVSWKSLWICLKQKLQKMQFIFHDLNSPGKL